jgi:hypothetical protein
MTHPEPGKSFSIISKLARKKNLMKKNDSWNIAFEHKRVSIPMVEEP